MNAPPPPIRPDPSQVRMAQNFETRYWMQIFGVSRVELEAAVHVVGRNAEDVRRHLLQIENERRVQTQDWETPHRRGA